MVYRLYNGASTPVAIPQPDTATWGRVSREPSSDGGARSSGFASVEWSYAGPMKASDFLLFTTYRPDSGLVTFDTWKKPTGASNATFVKCQGFMAEPSGVERDGEYYGVSVKFSAVREV